MQQWFTPMLQAETSMIPPPFLSQFVGVQVDVTSKTEGTAVGDKSGVPLLVKYDTRLRENGKNAVTEINQTVQVGHQCSLAATAHEQLSMQVRGCTVRA